MSRIPLRTRESLPEDERSRWDRAAARGGPLNIQRLFLANPLVDLNAFGVWKASGLLPRSRELIILRAAYLRESRYEWHQHVRIARGAGLEDADILAVRDWATSARFSGDESALLGYVDAMAKAQRPDDASFAAMAKGRTDGEVFGVTFLVALYFQLAQVMAAFDLETEEPFVGWDLAGATTQG